MTLMSKQMLHEMQFFKRFSTSISFVHLCRYIVIRVYHYVLCGVVPCRSNAVYNAQTNSDIQIIHKEAHEGSSPCAYLPPALELLASLPYSSVNRSSSVMRSACSTLLTKCRLPPHSSTMPVFSNNVQTAERS